MSTISFSIEGDSEFKPVVNSPTIPHSIGLKGNDSDGNELGFEFFLHPNHDSKVIRHKVFDAPCVLLEYFFPSDDTAYEVVPETTKRGKHILTVRYYMFWSFKDIEHLFIDRVFYRDKVLPYLSRTRRITGRVPLPYRVKYGSRYYMLSLDIIDISAMQGAAGLKTYASNVGIKMDAKETYTLSEKKDMPTQYDKDADKYVIYNDGDLLLRDIYKKTVEYYNWVASLVGVEARESWGMSTGKIVASITSAWLQTKTGLTSEQLENSSQLAGTEGLYNISQLRKKRDLVYLPMVDGGKATRDVFTSSLFKGLLLDIDIAGCYGNGLLNQDFPIGNPTVYTEPMSLREYEKKVINKSSRGLWYGRASTKGVMPFRQDLLISKEEDAFTHWENGITLEATRSDEDRVYDASMVLLRKEVRHAAFTYDLYQALKGCSSKTEWSWLLDNLIIESGLAYLNKDEVTDINKLDFKGVQVKDLRGSNQGAVWSTKWYRVSLKEFVGVLLNERGKVKRDPLHGKKSPRDQFLKLIINTIYGCTASEFFSKEAVSNVVVGNNITARARTLAYAMAKGLGLKLTVTDGGVLDINRVIFYKSLSLAKLELVSRGCFSYDERGAVRKFAEEGVLGRKEPGGYYIQESGEGQYRKYAHEGGLGGKEWTEADIPWLLSKVDPENSDMTQVDKLAWEHCAATFPFLDIFKERQFSFESKGIYRKLVVHSKVDYLLQDFKGNDKIALRGADKVMVNTPDGKEVKVDDPNTLKLFEAIETGVPFRYETVVEQMLSLGDYRKGLSSGRFGDLLPHDVYAKTKQFYSHTPLYLPFDTVNDFRNVMASYETAKLSKDPVVVKAVSDEYLTDYLMRD